ncbi:hypothetical protein IscW_ISCW022935, partial [Ixodes scapularis]
RNIRQMPEKRNKNKIKREQQEHGRCVWVSYKGNTERKLGTETRNHKKGRILRKNAKKRKRKRPSRTGQVRNANDAVIKETSDNFYLNDNGRRRVSIMHGRPPNLGYPTIKKGDS